MSVCLKPRCRQDFLVNGPPTERVRPRCPRAGDVESQLAPPTAGPHRPTLTAPTSCTPRLRLWISRTRDGYIGACARARPLWRCVYVLTDVCIYVCVHVHICMLAHIRTHSHKHIQTSERTIAPTLACLHSCMHARPHLSGARSCERLVFGMKYVCIIRTVSALCCRRT